MHLSFRNKCWIELETVEKAMKFVYANENHSTMINEKNGVVFLTFPKLVKAGVCHGFSTRIGGVSEGYLSSMNLSFTRGDDPQKVQENFQRIGEAIGFNAADLVLSSQIHETRIRKVTAKDKGDGIVRETVPGIDALLLQMRKEFPSILLMPIVFLFFFMIQNIMWLEWLILAGVVL